MKLNKRQFMRSFRTPPPTTIETDGEYNVHLPSPRVSQEFEVFEIYGNVDPHTDTPSIDSPLKIKHVGTKTSAGRYEIKLRIHGNNALGFEEFSSLCRANNPSCIYSADASEIAFNPCEATGKCFFDNTDIKFSKNTQYTLRALISGTPTDGILYTPLAFIYSDGTVEPITASDIYSETTARLCAVSAYGKTLVGLYHYPQNTSDVTVFAEGFGIFEGIRDFSDPYEEFVGTSYSYSTSDPMGYYEKPDGSFRYTIMDLIKGKLYSETELVDWTIETPTIRSFSYNGTCTIVTSPISRNINGNTECDGRSNIFRKKATINEIYTDPYCLYILSMPYYYFSLPGEFTTSADIIAHLKELGAEYYLPYLSTRIGTYGYKRPTLSPSYTIMELVTGNLSPTKTVIRLKE